MNLNKALIFIIIVAISFGVNRLQAQPPQLFNYQGKLSIDGSPADSSFNMTFSIYSSETGGTALWTNPQLVTVTAGVFRVLLGSDEPFPDNLFTNSGARFLGIKIENDPELTPRFRLTSVEYAIRAANADTAQVAREALCST